MDNYSFNRLGPDDVAPLVELERHCFSMPWNEKQFRLGLSGKVFNVFGFKDGDDIVAYVSFHHVDNEMEILNIAVRPESRRRGLGRRLLRLVLQICARMGIEKSYLEVRESNIAAKSLYLSLGYLENGRRKGYYTDTGEDALLMSLDLSSMDKTP